MAMALVASTHVGCSDPSPSPEREHEAPTPVEASDPETTSASALPAEGESGARAIGYEPTEGDDTIVAALEATRVDPASSHTWGALGAAFLRRHRQVPNPELLRLADDALDAALARDDHDLVALGMRGFLEMQAHEFADARTTARSILRIRHDNTTALLLLGDAELELGAYEEAVGAYQRAADIRPDLRVYNRGAYARWLHGDPQGALELLDLAIDAASPRDPEATAWCWVDVALVHWHGRHLDRAREALTNALSLEADYLPARRLEARLQWEEGRPDEAIATLTAVTERQELVGDLLLLAEMLEARGRSDDASARVARATAVRREDPRSLALYQARHGIETEAALAATTREVARRQDIYTESAHALALARAGRHDEAQTHLTRSLAQHTPDASIDLIAAAVHHLAGDDAAARVDLARASEHNPGADFFLAAWAQREIVDPAASAPAPSPGEPTGGP